MPTVTLVRRSEFVQVWAGSIRCQQFRVTLDWQSFEEPFWEGDPLNDQDKIDVMFEINRQGAQNGVQP